MDSMVGGKNEIIFCPLWNLLRNSFRPRWNLSFLRLESMKPAHALRWLAKFLKDRLALGAEETYRLAPPLQWLHGFQPGLFSYKYYHVTFLSLAGGLSQNVFIQFFYLLSNLFFKKRRNSQFLKIIVFISVIILVKAIKKYIRRSMSRKTKNRRKKLFWKLARKFGVYVMKSGVKYAEQKNTL